MVLKNCIVPSTIFLEEGAFHKRIFYEANFVKVFSQIDVFDLVIQYLTVLLYFLAFHYSIAYLKLYRKSCKSLVLIVSTTLLNYNGTNY